MRPLEISASVRSRIEEHVRAVAPAEACGILLGSAQGAGPRRVLEARPARNAAHDRSRRYVVEPEDLVTAVREARERSLVVLGYYHSHPEGPALPSYEDRRWAWPEASYLIVARAEGKLEARSWRLAGTDFVEEPVTPARDRVTR